MGYGPLPPPVEVVFFGEGPPFSVVETITGDLLIEAEDGSLVSVGINEENVWASLSTIYPAVVGYQSTGASGQAIIETMDGSLAVLDLDGVTYSSAVILTESGELATVQVPMIWTVEQGPDTVDMRFGFSTEVLKEASAGFNISNELSFSTKLSVRPFSLDSHIWVPNRIEADFDLDYEYFVPRRLNREFSYKWDMGKVVLRHESWKLGLGFMTGKLTKHQRDFLNFAWYKYPLKLALPQLEYTFTTTGVLVKTRDISVTTAFYNWDNLYFGYKQDMGIIKDGKSDVGIASNMGMLSNKTALLGIAATSKRLSNLTRVVGMANRTYGINTPVGNEFALAYRFENWESLEFNLCWDMLGRAQPKVFNLSSTVARLKYRAVGFATSLQYKVGNIPFNLGWVVERRLTVGKIIRMPFSVLAGAVVAHDLRSRVLSGMPLETPLNLSVRAGENIPVGLSGVVAGVQVTLPLNLGVLVGWGFDLGYSKDVRRGMVFDMPSREQVGSGVAIGYDLLGFTPVVAGVVLSSPAVDITPLVMSGNGSLVTLAYPAGLELLSAEVSADEGSYGWAGTFTLMNASDLSKVAPDEPFSVRLGSEDYMFLVESKTLRRDSPASRTATIKGMSPAVQLTAPRAARVTKTWAEPIMAHAVIEELVGGVVPLRNELLDWPIPAYRLGVTNAAPMDVIKQVAEAVGGMVCSDPDGTLVLQSKFKVSVPNWGVVPVDMQFVDADEVVSASDEYAPVEVNDKFRVMDTQSTSGTDRLEFEQTDADSGLIRAYPSPWRTTSILETTAFSVTIGTPYEEYRDEEETVEVYNGEASVRYPVASVNSVEWMDVDLGGVLAGNDSTRISSTHPSEKFSMLKISYKTRCLVYPIDGEVGSVAQFLLRNP